MMRILKTIYTNAQFHPGFIGMLINPFFLTRRALSHSVRVFAGQLHGKMLDVGCGSKPYQSFFTVDQYIGLEIDTPENRASKRADFFYTGNGFPFDDGEFDSVLSNEVLEHVFCPKQFVREIHRVLAPSGLLLLTVPFAWDEHEQPYDYGRYSSFGLRDLLQKAGFEILQLDKTCPGLTAILQLLNGHLFKAFNTGSVWLNIPVCLLLISPLNLLGWLVSYLPDRNLDIYLDNVVLCRKSSALSA